MPTALTYDNPPYVPMNVILGAPNLCGTIKTMKSGVPDVLGPAFYMKDKTVEGNTYEYKQYTGARQLSRTRAYGQPSGNRQLRELGAMNGITTWVAENLIFEPQLYVNLLSYDSLTKQKMGIEEVTRQLDEANNYLTNLRVVSQQSMFFLGTIWYDQNGNLLPTSAGARTTQSFNVPSGNQNQLNVLGSGNILTTTWSTNTTNIYQQLVNLKQASVFLNGYKIKHCYYGQNIASDVVLNTSLHDFMSRDAFRGDRATSTYYLNTGELPDELLGIMWHPAYDQNWLDDSNTIQSLVGANTVTFCPEPSLEWIGILEGTSPVNRFPGIINDYEASNLTQMDLVAGKFAYCIHTNDPVGIKFVYGDNFQPVLKIPGVVYQGTVG